MREVNTKDDIPSLLERANKCYNQGDLHLAEQLYAQILELDPLHALALLYMGQLAKDTANYDVALFWINKAVKAYPGNIIPINNMGMIFIYKEEYEKARICFQQSIRLAPGDARSYCYMGLSYSPESESVEALEYFNKALEIDPDNYEALNGVGRIYWVCEEFDKAEEYFLRAHHANPSSMMVLQNLAGISRITGRSENVELYVRKILEIRPCDGGSYFSLSSIKKYTSLEDKDIVAMQAAMEKTSLAPKDVIALHFSLGKAYGDCGVYDKAFYHYVQANNLKYKPRKEGIVLISEVLARSNAIELFTPEFYTQCKDYGSSSTLPYFIAGMPRSGTTLTEQILASHSQVAGAGELKSFSEIVRVLCGPEFNICAQESAKDLVQDAAKIERAKVMASAYLADIQGKFPHAKHIINKLPANYADMPFIRLLFPEAKVFHTRRHPLDTCLSIFFQHFSEDQYYDSNLSEITAAYKDCNVLIKKWQEVMPGYIHDIFYEELVVNMEKVVRGMLDFCGLEFEENCLAFHKNTRKVSTASQWQVRQPVYNTSRFRWKKYEKFIPELMEALAPEVQEYEALLQERGLLAEG